MSKKELKLPTGETVFYAYEPDGDCLTVHFASEIGRSESEVHPDFPGISILKQDGDVVGAELTSVQVYLLERLVAELAALAKPGVDTAPAPARAIQHDERPPAAARAEPPEPRPEAPRVAAPTAETEETSTEAGAPSAEGGDEAQEETPRPRRRRRRRRRGRRRSSNGNEAAAEGDGTQAAAAAPEPAVPQEPAAPSQPVPQAKEERRESSDRGGRGGRESGRGRRGGRRRGGRQERENERPVPTGDGRDWPYGQPKSAPIAGLDAPDEFLSLKLHPHIGQAITVLGFETPTPIQRRAIPPVLEGKDVVGLAQTGTGKTLAFLAPAMHRLLEQGHTDHRPRILVVTPTRELASQVSEEAEQLAVCTPLRVTQIYGGVGYGQQVDQLRRGTDLIVATPGRLLDHLHRGNVKLDEVEVLILDEADRILDMGFLPDVRSILRELPESRQSLLFSATMPPAIEHLSVDIQRDPVLVEVARQLPPETIDQRFFEVEKHLKMPILIHLLKSDPEMKTVLVFAETKAEADIVAGKLREADFPVALMHGDRQQRAREEALEQLRDGSARILVATDVAARGLDVPTITHVINYDMPQNVDTYVHRIGRTARGDGSGSAYTFVTLSDRGMVMRIESALEREIPRARAEGFDYDVPVPSWAKPSADDIVSSLHRPKNLADRFKTMMRRRR